MCGACGSGTVRAPWEVAAHGGSPRALADRARQAERLLGGRATVTVFGPAGFALRTPTGAATLHRSLDALLDRMQALAHAAVVSRAAADDSFVARAYLERHGHPDPA